MTTINAITVLLSQTL